MNASSNPPSRPAWQSRWFFGVLIVAATFLAYIRIWHGEFIWDDNLLIVDDPLIQRADGWWRLWCTKTLDYVPLASTLWWCEWRLWGLHPAGYHLVNLLLHAINAVLVWRVLERLAIPGARLAALFFALHPVNVATAAWIAEGKNTLAMLFFLLTLLAYLKFDDTGRLRWLWVAAGTFVLALAGKTAVAPLPVVLLGIIWWRHGRLTLSDLRRTGPFFLLAMLGGLLAVWIQSKGADLAIVTSESFLTKLAGAGMAVWFYLYETVWPVNLPAIHPVSPIDPSNPVSFVPLALLLACSVVCWRFRKGWSRGLLFGAGYFVVMLGPVLGFFNISYMRLSRVADHWQYFAIIGPIALFAAGIALASRRFLADKPAAFPVLSAALVGTLGLLTFDHSAIYVGSKAFWGSFMDESQPAMQEYYRGVKLIGEGKTDEALAQMRKALSLQPANALAENDLGRLLLQKGRVDEALDALKRAAGLRPDLPEARFNLGMAFLAKGLVAEALEQFQRQVDLRPDDPVAQNNFGNVLLDHGLADDAMPHFEKAIEVKPDFAQAHYKLAGILFRRGQAAAAVEHYRAALKIQPESFQTCNNLAWILATQPDARLRNGTEAVLLAKRADQLSGGGNPIVLGTLGAAFAEAGQFSDAVASVRRALAVPGVEAASAVAANLQAQLALYQARKPFRDRDAAVK